MSKKLTFKQIRAMFWEDHPQFKGDFRAKKRQNDYNCDIRISFVAWIDAQMKSGVITEKQAKNIIL